MQKLGNELKEYLMQLDREFDEATAKMGVEGWVAYFDEEGAMLPSKGEVVRGKEAIRSSMIKGFSLTDFSLRWSPMGAEVSEDGSMGYTYGEYMRKFKDADGEEITGTGRYTTIWRKQTDGNYKIIHDVGN